MERNLFLSLDYDFRLSKLNKKFELSREFDYLHTQFCLLHNSEKYFKLEPRINVKRKDQLLLNLQYNNLLFGFPIYSYEYYCQCAEEFCTYFLNYEIVSGRCSPQFPENIRAIFLILNQYNF